MRLAILISGTGSNMKSIVKHFPKEVKIILTNNPNSKGIQWAIDNNYNSSIINHKNYENRLDFDKAVHEKLKQNNIDLVILAGFMRILTPEFVSRWKRKILNIHPSYLPNFKGHNAIEMALESGIKQTGVTVHIVTPELDSGPIIKQERVDIVENDDILSLSDRIHKVEHRLYPEAIKSYMKSIEMGIMF